MTKPVYVVVIAPLLALLTGIGFHAAVVWWGEHKRVSQAWWPEQ